MLSMPLLRRPLNAFVFLLVLCASLFAQAPNFAETKKRAEAGSAKAQNDLAQIYNFGEGVPRDDEEAVRWYRKAAEQGYAYAQSNLGHMYKYGMGVPMDAIEAYAWYNLAAVRRIPQPSNIYQDSKFLTEAERMRYESAVKFRDKLNLTPEQMARAQKRSTELFNEIEARKKAAGK
jgi:TPR repeat protein